jgi:hypothetical protein
MIDAIRSQIVGGIPLSSTTRIVLDVDPAASPSDVMKHYIQVRDRLAPRGLPAVDDRNLELAQFVAEHPDPDRHRTMQLWNDRFPQWSYADEDAFYRDAVRARRSILEPPW